MSLSGAWLVPAIVPVAVLAVGTTMPVSIVAPIVVSVIAGMIDRTLDKTAAQIQHQQDGNGRLGNIFACHRFLLCATASWGFVATTIRDLPLFVFTPPIVSRR